MEQTNQSRRGRPESPVSPQDGPAAVLAVELRRLRERCGLPSYREMSVLAQVSPSALSEAARGRRWPSWQVVAGYVTACGEDPETWRERWEALRPVAQPPTQPTPDAEPPGEEPPEGEAERTTATAPPRQVPRLVGVGVGFLLIVGLIVIVVAAVGGRHGGTSSAPPAATSSAPPGPVPVRRHGTLVLAAGQVADLDSMAANWDEQSEPGPSTADVWFGATDHALHGQGNNDIAVLPRGAAGGFWPCALEQDYGVTLAAPDIRPGRLLCGLTAANRVAQLRITGVRYGGSTGKPDQVTFDVTVWVPLHKT